MRKSTIDRDCVLYLVIFFCFVALIEMGIAERQLREKQNNEKFSRVSVYERIEEYRILQLEMLAK